MTMASAKSHQSPNMMHLLPILVLLPALTSASPSPGLPMVINTWSGPFVAATDAAYRTIANGTALDAVEAACITCERNQCDGSVGFGGSPDEACETTLDALIIDGTTMNAGAVAGLRRISDAISVARRVLDFTQHTLLVGDQATQFARQNGFVERDLATAESVSQCEAWKAAACQPNYHVNVEPDPSASCGPYTPKLLASSAGFARQASHDTLSIIAIHASGAMAAGTTTNGASHKVPGRVGDGPIVGSGSYVDGDVGGCGATGDGDIMMRFLPCYQAVENLRRGMTPEEAAEDAVRRMVTRFPDVASGIVVVDREGRHAGAGSGWTFTYSYRGGSMDEAEVVTVPPIDARFREL